MELKKRILVAPLNWGLGHATRCIPIINALMKYHYEPVIASDGLALELLKKEFPTLTAITLPSYHISYPKNGKYFKLHLMKTAPKILNAIRAEKSQIQSLIKHNKIDGIISDNRFGVYHKNVPSVFITHQLNVLSGSTTWMSSKIHQQMIHNFDECWVPDVTNTPSLSGKLGHLKQFNIPIKYMGIISRFNPIALEKKYDLLVLLSGPEPQRTLLEQHILEQLKTYNGTILFVKGKIEAQQTKTIKGNLTIVNYMKSDALEIALNVSSTVISRSGYTTILDLAKLGKKAFFIPTPGQFEQEYLAERLDKRGIAPYCHQEEFTIDQLHRIKTYTGFDTVSCQIDFKALFYLFECK
ncbi:MAG: glycosyltransferase [Flavobacteriaceae bacterium]|nr:glycosyltransferase [Flavobacteriaceae bacterium]